MALVTMEWGEPYPEHGQGSAGWLDSRPSDRNHSIPNQRTPRINVITDEAIVCIVVLVATRR